jgi:dTMP kinase
MRGKFITLEGIDGAGKSTHLGWLIAALQHSGRDVVATREPGGTPLGEALREIVLSRPMHLETEALLMFAARREHLDKLILPALDAGKWVVSDRFTDATYAYQGGGRGLSMNKIAALERWVHPQLQPDLTLLFDLDPRVAMERLSRSGVGPDRFEREQGEFFAAVRACYLERARRDPGRIRVLDASRPPDVIQRQLEEIFRTYWNSMAT